MNLNRYISEVSNNEYNDRWNPRTLLCHLHMRYILPLVMLLLNKDRKWKKEIPGNYPDDVSLSSGIIIVTDG